MCIIHHAADGNSVVFLIDDKQGRSLTNMAESICRRFSKFARIIYRDTDNRWDEMVHDQGTFRDFAPLSDQDRKTFAQFLINEMGES